ncbi:MAG: hypothetical protein K5Q00_05365 [Gammaproteobacteria bacterium]|nr:hypothetical protein [Gammaproteobacteria bacterium]
MFWTQNQHPPHTIVTIESGDPGLTDSSPLLPPQAPPSANYHTITPASQVRPNRTDIAITIPEDLPLSKIFINDMTDAIKLAVMAGGCYLSFTGTKSLFDLITPEEVSYIVAAITATTNFQIFRSSKIDLKEFDKNKIPCILFAAGNAFTSALLTYREAPVEWQKWAFSAMNGLVNIPFGTDTVLGNIANATDFIKFWRGISGRERVTLFFNFILVFAIVLCCLIGYAAPVITLLVHGLSQVIANSWVIYGLTGFITAVTNCVECFFQINAMLCFTPTEQKTVWFGYVSVPWGTKATNDTLRFCLAIIFSLISSLSFGGFTATTLRSFAPLPVTIALSVLSLVAPFWSNMKAADSALAAPIAHLIRHPLDTLSGIISSGQERLRPYYTALCCMDPSARGYNLLQDHAGGIV